MRVIALTLFTNDGKGNSSRGVNVAEAGAVLDDLHQRGILQSIYLRKDHPGTVVTLECGTLEDAHKYLSRFPGVADGGTTYELIPLGSEIPPSAFVGVRMKGK